MHIGLVGLGKMGANMRQRIRAAGIDVTGYDRNPDAQSPAGGASAAGRSAAGVTASAAVSTVRAVGNIGAVRSRRYMPPGRSLSGNP